MILWLMHKRVPLLIIAAILVLDWIIGVLFGAAIVAWELRMIREHLGQ